METREYCFIEDMVVTFCFMVWLIGVALLPIAGFWSLALIVPGWTCCEIVNGFIEWHYVSD